MLFEGIPCPLCGQAEFDVIKTARYSGNESAADLRQAYSASSNHKLLDQVVRCRGCRLHYVNPRPRPDLIIASYAAAEDQTFVAQNAGRIHTFTKILRKVLALEGREDGGGRRLLDIGCAGAACLAAAKSLQFQTVGVEPSRWMADFGRRTYKVEVHDGVLEPGMFPEESFEFITLWDVLEHVPDPKALLDLAASLLRPDGTFLLSYPDFHSSMGRLLGKRWPFWLSVHLLYYDRVTITKQLALSGFHIEQMMPYWMTLQLGYVVDRAIPYIPALRVIRAALNRTGLSHIPINYTMGQTIVLAKKTPA